MTAPVLSFADAREAADLAAFLARLIHYDRAAVVRLQAGNGVLAVFGRPPSFEVLAIRTALLTDAGTLDVTVSAGQLADALDSAAPAATGPGPDLGAGDTGPAGRASGPGGSASGGVRPPGPVVPVPATVTGPPWAGVLPPRGGWRAVEGLPGPDELRAAVAAAVAEFRARDEALAPEQRTRAHRERVGREIWSRTVGDTGLPLRAVHAAQSLGFLRTVRVPAATAAGARAGSRPYVPAGAGSGPGGPIAAVPGAPAPGQIALLAAPGWLRLRTPYGSVAVRTGGLSALPLTPA
ncbi:hypothetical protein IHE55_08805 [Streptomyces pactum]|uniref:FAD-binding PCMH-type domain-containing protein n=1 Tax=Streptomyces pactum TaxID=68249 RepID=A0ABS0NI66_9ACTN|nr:hypothetical protein [Streptomyces pactum]MBH5334886.1 hypothetical protein [Streptomyces pactum]